MDCENIDYLQKIYPERLSQIKKNARDYRKKVMGEVKTYLQKRPSLVFQRSQENLFVFGFYKEACVVSRVVLEDVLRREYNPSRNMVFKTIIENYLPSEELKKLAHLIRENGNVFAHESFNSNNEDNLLELNARQKAIESAKSLNKIMVDLGFKTPEYIKKR